MDTTNSPPVSNTPVALTKFGADSFEERKAIAEEVLRRIVDYYKPLRV